MKRLMLVVGMLVLCSSTSEAQKKSRCAPVTGDYLKAGVVLRDCEVSQRAELKVYPNFDDPIRMEGAQTCYTAWYDFVVDTTGHVVEETAKLIKTNNRAWADNVKQHLGEARFEPAMKDGQRVQQLVRFKPAIGRIIRSSAGAVNPGTAGAEPLC